MRLFLFLVVFLLAGSFANAQHNHFVYLQADNKQPFYVKVKGNLYSSSASGYLIIPKLQAGTHELAIGFPKNQWPSQNIPVTISGKDLGYLLKNFENKGWGLFNIQTMDVIMATTAGAAVAAKPEVKSDEFSNALADVVNTPSIKEVNPEEKKPETLKKEDPVAVVPVANSTYTPKNEAVPAVVTKVKSAVTRVRTSQTAEASDIIYLVSDEYGSDTVNVSIALEKEITVERESKPVEVAEPKENKTKGKEEATPKFIDINLPNPNVTAKEQKEPQREATEKLLNTAGNTAINPEAGEKGTPLKMINSDCKAVATEDDFLKTRKKMTAQKSDEDMVNQAKKLFKQKCYSTAQVKNLSVLFLKDEGKYKFFDAIYPFVYDSREFKQLESQLTDEYYISRFRSMIRN